MAFGTSNNYTTGVTNQAITIDRVGAVTIAALGGTATGSRPSGYDRVVLANNTGALAQLDANRLVPAWGYNFSDPGGAARGTPTLPADYICYNTTVCPAGGAQSGIYREFRTLPALGFTDPNVPSLYGAAYATLQTIVSYPDASGGAIHQLAFINSGTYEGKILHRTGRRRATGSAWNSWNEIGTSAFSSSDMRYKSDIAPIASALSTLEKLQGVRYNWNRSTAPEFIYDRHPQIGVIAQQVESVLPELVRTDPGGYKSVNYTGFIPLLIEGVKEQQAQIRATEKQLGEHRKRLDAQQATLEEHAGRLDEHQRRIGRAERLIGRLDERTGKLEIRIGEADERITRLTERADTAEGFMARFDTSRPDVLAVKTPNFQVSNLTAERAEVAELRARRLQAEQAKFKTIEAEEGRMTGRLQAQSMSTQTLSAQRVATGEREVFVSYGSIATLFEVPEGAHYVVSVTSADGSYAMAMVVRAGGQLRVVPTSAQGIDLVAQGLQVGVVAPSRRVKASWLRTG